MLRKNVKQTKLIENVNINLILYEKNDKIFFNFIRIMRYLV